MRRRRAEPLARGRLPLTSGPHCPADLGGAGPEATAAIAPANGQLDLALDDVGTATLVWVGTRAFGSRHGPRCGA